MQAAPNETTEMIILANDKSHQSGKFINGADVGRKMISLQP